MLEEDLITGLMLEEGIDVNVVPHLEHLDPESTGRLCLEGIAGDWVLFSWLTPVAAWRALAARGVRGQLGAADAPAVRDAEDRSSANGAEYVRTIYCLDLHASNSAVEHLEIVRRLRDEARVRTFSIGQFPREGAAPAEPRPDRGSAGVAPSQSAGNLRPGRSPNAPAPRR